MKGAPNPWRGPGEHLDTGNLSGTEILEGLTEIIGSWPGEKTAVIDPQDRHLRFVLAVAGYPEVESSTRPFDMPLSGKSTRCLNISRMIDSVVGMHQNTSLRSSILNNDLHLRSSKGAEDEKALESCHKECLSLLFARLRQIDGAELPTREDDTYRPEEEALLAVLHSYDNDRRLKWWPSLRRLTNTEKGDFSHIIGSAMLAREMPDRTKHPEEFEKWRRLKESEKKEKWLTNNGISDRFSFNSDDKIPLTFQFHYVQSWLRRNFPSIAPGQNQRFLRGASIFLELAVSECRHRIAREVGIGSITADGGGRVSFLCPKEDELKMRGLLEKSVFEFLMILGTGEDGEEEGSFARNNVRFDSTIRKWGRCCELRSQAAGDTTPAGRLTRQNARLWSREIGSKLPPFSITDHDINPDTGQDALTRLSRRFENDGSPRKLINQPRDQACSFCPPIGSPELDRPQSLSHRMGVSQPTKEDLDKEEICPFHRLMFLLGHDQRLRDSTLRAPGPEDTTHQRIDTGGQRKVTSISRVDGNSLGIIFQERHDNDFDQESELHDRRRRRSFRFNTVWWTSLQKAVDVPGLGDRVAAWVTAGDDVVLAEYGMVNGETRQAGESLRTALDSWARALSEVDEMDEEMFLSFGAGLSLRKEPESESRQIQEMMEIAGLREESSKRRWKSKIDSERSGVEVHPMLKLRGEVGKVDWEPEEGWEDTSFVTGTLSMLVEEGGEERTQDEEAEVDRFEGFEGWTDTLIQQILSKRNLSNLDEDEKWEMLSRHYLEMTGDELTLVVLPEKQG